MKIQKKKHNLQKTDERSLVPVEELMGIAASTKLN